jgi:hypothetical protein
MNSRIVVAGTVGLTTNASGPAAIAATGVNCRTGSYPGALDAAATVVNGDATNSSV